MTIWTDLQAAIEAKITALGYTGTLANLGIDQPYSPDLVTLLELQAQLGAISGGGTMAVTGTFWQTTQPVSFASTPTINIGTVSRATSAPTTSVASSATSVTLLALNANRRWASFRNDSTSVAYIAKSGTASASSVYQLEPQGYLYFDDYTGIVTAIWVSANGFMRIEEGV